MSSEIDHDDVPEATVNAPPSTDNSTLLTPTLSAAEPATTIEPETDAPAVGVDTETEGAAVSAGAVEQFFRQVPPPETDDLGAAATARGALSVAAPARIRSARDQSRRDTEPPAHSEMITPSPSSSGGELVLSHVIGVNARSLYGD